MLVLITSCYAPKGIIPSREATGTVVKIEIINSYGYEGKKNAAITIYGSDGVYRWLEVPLYDTSRFYIGRVVDIIIKR